ncbi:MAG TPA: hypothetical protein VIH99_08245 [Bdellovibrionota bacterium]|jgi:hypothetical protein
MLRAFFKILALLTVLAGFAPANSAWGAFATDIVRVVRKCNNKTDCVAACPTGKKALSCSCKGSEDIYTHQFGPGQACRCLMHGEKDTYRAIAVCGVVEGYERVKKLCDNKTHCVVRCPKPKKTTGCGCTGTLNIKRVFESAGESCTCDITNEKKVDYAVVAACVKEPENGEDPKPDPDEPKEPETSVGLGDPPDAGSVFLQTPDGQLENGDIAWKDVVDPTKGLEGSDIESLDAGGSGATAPTPGSTNNGGAPAAGAPNSGIQSYGSEGGGDKGVIGDSLKLSGSGDTPPSAGPHLFQTGETTEIAGGLKGAPSGGSSDYFGSSSGQPTTPSAFLSAGASSTPPTGSAVKSTVQDGKSDKSDNSFWGKREVANAKEPGLNPINKDDFLFSLSMGDSSVSLFERVKKYYKRNWRGLSSKR